MPTIFRIVFAIVVNDVSFFVADTQAVTLGADDLPFLVVRPTFCLVNSVALDLHGVPTFALQTFPETVPELAVNEFLMLMITQIWNSVSDTHSSALLLGIFDFFFVLFHCNLKQT